jgi:hypothetical protein
VSLIDGAGFVAAFGVHAIELRGQKRGGWPFLAGRLHTLGKKGLGVILSEAKNLSSIYVGEKNERDSSLRSE